MNSSQRSDLDLLSTKILQSQYYGNILALTMSLIGVLMASTQAVLILCWKPLRGTHQILILTVAFGDGFKGLVYAISYIKRLGKTSDLQTNMECLLSLLPVCVSTYYCLISVLCLSAERLIAIAAPIWYRSHSRGLKIGLVIVSVVLSMLCALLLMPGASPNRWSVHCSLITSPTDLVRKIGAAIQNILALAMLSVNMATGIIVLRRWKLAQKLREDMQVLKRELQLNVLKTLFAVVSLFLISIFAGAVLMTIMNFAMWNEQRVAEYAPYVATLGLCRGMLDFMIYMALNPEYRKGFMKVFCRRDANAVTEIHVNVPISASKDRHCTAL